MITQLILDTIGQDDEGQPTELLRAGLPIAFIDWGDGVQVWVQLPDGREIAVEAAAVGSGLNGPEETVSALAEKMDIAYNTLIKAVREGRVLARKSASTWFTTARAVEYAQETGRLR